MLGISKIYNFKGDFMEMKQYITIEVQKNDFNFVFQMPSGASWGNAIDAGFDVLQKLNELSLQSIQAANPNPAPLVDINADPVMVVQGE
jgi:hypothetical protein